MSKNLVKYFIDTVKKYPNKTAFVDKNRNITFKELFLESNHIAFDIINYGISKKPVAVYLEKSVECIAAYMGVLLSGNFYSPLDVEMPISRINKIIETFSPDVIVTDRLHFDTVVKFSPPNAKIVVFEDAQTNVIEDDKLEITIDNIIDTDVMYVLFTSGSTGVPKGVVVSHAALTDFVDWATEKYNFDQTTIFGNQVPFYFSMCVWDIYLTIKCGACCHIINHDLFMFPNDLMKYVADNEINTLVWVPSALICVVNLKGLKKHRATSLKNVLFGGEVMPIKKLNKWMDEYPDVNFVNIYGPTEVTDTFMAYTVNRRFNDFDALPIGEPRSNHQILILDDNNNEINNDDIGELCVRGRGLATGYYNNPEQTQKAFVQNPLNSAYPDLIYRTGDLVKYNEFGELTYVARKDFQIKHMGHRIELGEIDNALTSIEGVDEGCCLYDAEKSKIVAFYSGNATESHIANKMQSILPSYMLPNVRIHLDVMPHNLNGKIDRAVLKTLI